MEEEKYEPIIESHVSPFLVGILILIGAAFVFGGAFLAMNSLPGGLSLVSVGVIFVVFAFLLFGNSVFVYKDQVEVKHFFVTTTLPIMNITSVSSGPLGYIRVASSSFNGPFVGMIGMTDAREVHQAIEDLLNKRDNKINIHLERRKGE